MLLGRYTQQPGENLKRLIDYDAWLEDDEEIDTVVAVVTPVTDPPFLVTNILIDDEAKKFAYYAGGGVTGNEYEVEFTMTTNIDQTRQDEVEFEVEEI
jgi:hypothetical protein